MTFLTGTGSLKEAPARLAAEPRPCEEPGPDLVDRRRFQRAVAPVQKALVGTRGDGRTVRPSPPGL
jgi:hypothetical protein